MTQGIVPENNAASGILYPQAHRATAGREIQEKGGFVGEQCPIFVFVTFAAIAAARANSILRFIFQIIPINGGEQPLPFSYPDLRDSFSPPLLEKYFFPTDHIFSPDDGHKTSLHSGKEAGRLDPHDDIPSVVDFLRQTLDSGYRQKV